MRGAALLWKQACVGAAETLVDLGVIESLTDVIRTVVLVGGGTSAQLYCSAWATACLWRCLASPGATAIAAKCGAIKVLLGAMELQERSEAYEAMRRCAVGAICLMFGNDELQGKLLEAMAPERLRMLVVANKWAVVTRRSALLAIESFDKALRLGIRVGGSATSQMPQLASLLMRDPSEEVRANACRMCSRLAVCGYQQQLVDLGAPKLLLDQMHGVIAELFDRAMQTKEHPDGAEAVGGESSLAARADFQPFSLFYDALNAVLNLSCASVGQPPLARHGLWALLQLRFSADALCNGDDQLRHVSVMAGLVLMSIAHHSSNLTVMYRAELQLKAALLGGKVHSGREAGMGPRSLSAPSLRSSHTLPPLHASGSPRGKHVDIGESDSGDGGSGTRHRYIKWLQQVIHRRWRLTADYF